ncbi:MAG TPA: dienelactone hydrolase family protein [Thermodesulfobacteriota bacterium]|nr:dienelactone hydrolase family protein [Thermodesulfobacteriota bacterium]
MNAKRGLAAALAAAAAWVVASGAAIAAIRTQEIEYRQGDTTLQGFLAYDDAVKGKRPGILVIHEWWGHNQHARRQALRLARAGYVAFALDMYGKGKVAAHPKDAQAFMEQVVKDPQLLAARFNAALDVLKQQPQVDPEKIGAVGYCFGGTVALTMARAGADLDAVVAVHAGLSPVAGPAEKGKVKARILVLTGGADPMVPKTQVEAFRKEMQEAGATVRIVTFPKARHSFTNPDADKVGMEALRYDPDADRRSRQAMVRFFKEAFGV